MMATAMSTRSTSSLLLLLLALVLGGHFHRATPTAHGFSLMAPLKRAAAAVAMKVNGAKVAVEPTTPTTKIDIVKNLEQQVLNAPSLLDQLLPYASMPLEHAITFPPEAYVNEDLFAVEKETIFKPGWICVAHISQIRNKGDYITLDLLDERMVIVNSGPNSEDGKGCDDIQVLSRVCSHRWASICETGQGNCNTNKFTCPMHRWSFDLEGNLLGAPYMDDVADFDKSNHGLQKYKSETIGGFVYVNIDGTAEPLDPQIRELTDYMENWETESAELFNVEHELNYDCDFNWKIMIETFMEAYHHFGAHATTFEPCFPTSMSYIEKPRPGYMVGHAPPRPGKEDVAYDNGLPFFPKLDKQRELQAFAFINVFPIHMMLILPDAVIWHRVQPVSARKTLFQAFCLVPPETMKIENLDSVRKEYMEFMDQFNFEDIDQNINMQKGVESGSAKIGRLHTQFEAAVWQLNAYVSSKVIPNNENKIFGMVDKNSNEL